MYAVIVKAGSGEAQRAELARNLAPTLGLDARNVERMLQRGPITVESSLGEDEAHDLCKRLVAMRIPAEVIGEDVTIQSMRLPTPSAGMPSVANFASGVLDENSEQTVQVGDVRQFSVDFTSEPTPDEDAGMRMPRLNEISSPSISKEPSDPFERDATIQGFSLDASDFGSIDDFFEAPGASPMTEVSYSPMSSFDEPSDPHSRPTSPPSLFDIEADGGEQTQESAIPVDEASSAPSGGNAWGLLFPDLEHEEESSPPEQAPLAASGTSPLRQEQNSPAPAVTPTPAPTPTPTPERQVPGVAAGSSLFGEEPASVAAPPLRDEVSAPSFGVEQAVASSVSSSVTPAQSVSQSPISSPGTPQQMASSGIKRREFQGGKLLDALSPDETGAPPFKPEGFDAGIPHSSILATIFAVVAPGAGQVYNGDDDDALDYGLKFFLVMPWINGVKEARERAKKIESFWAPRPAEGNFLRTFRYMGAFYLATGFVMATVIWLGGVAYERATRKPAPLYTESEVTLAVDGAKSKVSQARIAGLDSLGEAMQNLSVRGSEMGDEERAERLYLQGYGECISNKFLSCEAMMRRVLKFDSTHRDAMRLQAWASLRRAGGTQPFPKVDEQGSLQDYELEQEKKLQAKEQGAKNQGAPETPPEKAPDGATDAAPDETTPAETSPATTDDAGTPEPTPEESKEEG